MADSLQKKIAEMVTRLSSARNELEQFTIEAGCSPIRVSACLRSLETIEGEALALLREARIRQY